MRTPVGLAVAVLMGLGALQAFSHRETPPLAATQLAVNRMHLNTLNQSKAGMVAGGELGNLLYSTDQGKHWLPAKVSDNRQALINQISFAADGMEGMAVGHEGWILHTTDGGLSWQEVAFDEKNGEPLMGVARLPSGAWIASEMPVQASFYGHSLRPDGSIVLVGQGSLVATSKDGGAHFSISRVAGRASLTDVLMAPDGTGWLASDAGLQPYSLAAAPAPAPAAAVSPEPAPAAAPAPAAGSTPSSTGAAQ